MYPPCVRVFQSAISRALSSASSMKITSVSNHGFVKCALLSHRCNVPMMYKALYWEEQAGLSTVCSSHKAGYSIFMFFLVVVQQAEKIFTKHCHFTLRQAVFQDFAKVLRVRVSLGIIRTKMPWVTPFSLGTLQWGSLQSFAPSLTSKYHHLLQSGRNR